MLILISRELRAMAVTKTANRMWLSRWEPITITIIMEDQDERDYNTEVGWGGGRFGSQ